ncbi:DHA2 family efflux MFS transporter permease subunit [Pseudoalteromonas ardens]|uniref:Major facilitator superfamily (MFS) profile domain-containing protein n=1 Tax=Pseudoalteromonas rubra TaxID=43658 RepID=A0A0L0EQX0_9GAMM|nr:DHA2 family efflux MFS transporter permease subunit [Pseudoalteromonas sp. R96]KNC66887.1 hypothetical protein AC626_14290 [Pseudoalteromonas rubra]MDK1312380.1 DHA2 family efflux MFS transporter permease subunit [Pseudoalteromonas sp. R96]
MFNRQTIACIFTVGLGSFSTLLSSTTIEVAFVQVMGELAMDLSEAHWTVSLYMVVMTIAMLLTADLVNRIGCRYTFIVSFIIMISGSLIGALADGLFSLLCGRALQGFAAGLQAPLATIILGRIFAREKMGIAMGFFGAIMLLAPALGPVIGGYLIDFMSWRGLFAFQIPMAALSLLCALIFLNPDKPQQAAYGYDWAGLCILTGVLSGFFISLQLVEEVGVYATEFAVSCGVSALLALMFYFYEKNTAQPLVNFALFRDTVFSVNIVVICVLGIFLFSSILIVPLYLLEIRGLSARQAGEALLIPGLIMAFMAPFSGWLSDRFPPREIILCGLLINAYAIWLTAQQDVSSAIIAIVVATSLSRIGMSVMLPSLYVSSLRHLDGPMLAYGSSMINFARQIGGALGVMLFSLLYERSKYIASDQLWQSAGNAMASTGYLNLDATSREYSRIEQGIHALSGTAAFQSVFYLNLLMNIICLGLLLLTYLPAWRATLRKSQISDSPASP